MFANKVVGDKHTNTLFLLVTICINSKNLAGNLLIWQVNQSFYDEEDHEFGYFKKKYLKQRNMPFIKFNDGPLTFWPDLGSCFYSKDMLRWYNDNGEKNGILPTVLNSVQ